jgi:hypothetical protein
MSSVALSLYDNDSQRESCYDCKDSGSGIVKTRGKEFRLECRMFTNIGAAVETRLSAQKTDIFQTNLIDIVEVGVDSAEITFGKKFQFKAQSRGGGGLSKYECGNDYQIPELIKHQKIGYTELIYVHFKGCPKELISTELQSMVYELDNYSESYNTENMLSDMFLLAGREAVSQQVQYTDIIGVFGSADEKANSYDGILAQAYWAYTLAAYFHSVKFKINETVFVTGTYLHAKYAGLQIDILFDDSQASAPAMNRYQTRAEVYEAIVNWLNDDVRTASDRKYVDATFNNNELIVTSKWAETTVNLSLYIDDEPKADWVSCAVFTGVSYTTLQGTMPIDERPVLVKWRRYTDDNILQALPHDIYKATRDLDNTLLVAGQAWALYIDDYLWKQYRQALKTRPNEATAYNIEDDFNVYTIDALSQQGGTGIWFVTVEAQSTNLRNIAHLVDTADRSLAETIQIRLSDDCREMKMFYELLHGVMVKDFRLFASNLLCSPFVALLNEPYEKTLPSLPCWNRKVRDNFMNPSKYDDSCELQASFCKVDEYQNCALYAVPDGSGGYDIHVLEAGATKPNGALPVYEIQFKDKSVGISPSQIAGATYSYLVQTSDGLEYTLTGKDPILSYVSLSAGTTFNIIQTVTLENGCSSTYDASLDFEQDFPFECRGACDSITPLFAGRIERSNNYELLSGTSFNTNINVYALGSSEFINMTGVPAADAAAAAVVINQWFEDNNYSGIASGTGADLIIFSPEVIFIDTVGGQDFANAKNITIVNNTQFDEADGIETIEILAYCQGAFVPTTPTYEALPNNESVEDCATGWNIEIDFTTKLGCSFDDLTVAVAVIPDAEYFINFELTV